MEKRKIAKQVIGDALRFRFGVKAVELCGDLLNGVLAIAELNDFQTGTIESQGTLGHEQHSGLLRFFI
jgi:hypothetical protein